MANAELDIVIGAKVDGGVTNMNRFNNALIKTEQTAAKFNKTATRDFTGLSRVIQDLPFGFIGIQNNITQLLPAAGGLGLALSAIISAVTFAQVGFRNWTRGLTDNKEAIDANKKAVEELHNSAGKEIGQLTVLATVAADVNASMSNRLTAVKTLQKEFPQYFANLSQEQILNGQVATAIQDTAKALYIKAAVQQKESQLGPLAAQLFDLRQQRAELEKQEATLKRMNAISGRTRTRQGIVSSLIGAGSQDRKAVADVTRQIAELDKVLLPIQGQIKGITQGIIDLANQSSGGLFDPVIEKVKKAKKEFKEFQYYTFDPNIVHVDIPVRLDPNFDSKSQLKPIERDLNKTPVFLNVKFREPTNEEAANFSATVSKILTDTLNNSIASIGEGLGKAFSGQDNPFRGLLDNIAEGLRALGKYMIEFAHIQILVSGALSSLNPILSIGAGIALTALAGVIRGGAKAFAAGGVVTSPTLALIGERGPERITPLGYEGAATNSFTGELSTRVSGNDLVILLNRTNKIRGNVF